jgi:hypothetical protein
MSINTTLLAPSTVRLFGRVLRLGGEAAGPKEAQQGGGVQRAAEDPKVLIPVKQEGYLGASQLVEAMKRGELRLAHIFGFTHEGRYTPMHVPALFLVHGEGVPLKEEGKENEEIDPARLGLAHLEKGNLAFASDLRFWAYDRGDETIRLDVSTGTLLQLAIDAETGPAGGQGRRIDVFGQEGSAHARLARGSY